MKKEDNELDLVQTLMPVNIRGFGGLFFVAEAGKMSSILLHISLSTPPVNILSYRITSTLNHVTGN